MMRAFLRQIAHCIMLATIGKRHAEYREHSCGLNYLKEKTLRVNTGVQLESERSSLSKLAIGIRPKTRGYLRGPLYVWDLAAETWAAFRVQQYDGTDTWCKSLVFTTLA